jgi:glucosylglycerate synthase
MPPDVTTQERLAVRTEVRTGDDSFLTDDFLRELIDVGEVDILVGVPTHNNAKTIGPVVQAIQAGILKAFPRERAVIINADGGSRDGTPEAILNASIDDVRRVPNVHALRTLHAISTQYANAPSSGAALRTILSAAELLRAKACALICPEGAATQSDSLPTLLRPIYREGFDLALPTYRRHKFDGLLVTNLLYPMSRALYGLRIREPYPSDFAFSGGFGSQFLTNNTWHDEMRGVSPEMYFTIAAITANARISQAFLGPKEQTDSRSGDLVPALRRSVGALFSSLEPTFSVWSSISGSRPVPTTGPEQDFSLDPLRVNRKRLHEMFVTGIAELQSVFQSILTPATLGQLQQAAGLAEDDFQYPQDLWVKTVYEFASSYQKSVINRDHIIQALAPLFRGRAFTFLVENRNASANEVEQNIDSLCVEFERQKSYLLELWNAGK